MKLISILLLLSINTCAFAKNAVLLDKGDSAPFTGILLTRDKAVELDKAQRSNIVLKDLSIAQDEIIMYHKDDAMRQRVKLSEAKFDSHMKSALYFVLGAVLTGLTFKLNQKIGDM